MCGFSGLIGQRITGNFQNSLHAIAHRGPDNQEIGSFEFRARDRQHQILLGHVRLSVIDPSATSNQPFTSNCGRYTMVFNGEIYNYLSLRSELIGYGRSFRSNSDTEVLLEGFIQYGLEWFQRLDGMYAGAIFDHIAGCIHLFRDPVGIKPLYFQHCERGDQFAFSSEIRGLRPIASARIEPDPKFFAEFLLNGFIYEPNTGLTNCEKIAPGTVVTFQLGNSGVERLETTRIVVKSLLDEQAEGRYFFDREIGNQLIADVPLGLFFSGGIDSTVLADLTPRNVQAIHVAMESSHLSAAENDTSGDTFYARQISSILNLRYCEISDSMRQQNQHHSISEIQNVANGIEELTSDYTYVSTRHVSKAARQSGMTVMLSGMGADELFGGYPRYRIAHYLDRFRGNGILSNVAKFTKHIQSMARKSNRLQTFLTEPDWYFAYTGLIGYFNRTEVELALGSVEGVIRFRERVERILPWDPKASAGKRAMQLDRTGFLSHNLIVTDKASMRESLEVRVPFLSNACVAASELTSFSSFCSPTSGKLNLHRVLKGRLPGATIRRKKAGFNPPLGQLVKAVGADGLAFVLLFTKGILGAEFVLSIFDKHERGEVDNTYRIWQLLFFSAWLESNT